MFKLKNLLLSLSLIGLSSFLVSCEDDRYENYDSTPSGSTEFTPPVNKAEFTIEVAYSTADGVTANAAGHPFVVVKHSGPCPSNITNLNPSEATNVSLNSSNVATLQSGVPNTEYCVTNSHYVQGGSWVTNNQQISGCSVYWQAKLTYENSSILFTKNNVSYDSCL